MNTSQIEKLQEQNGVLLENMEQLAKTAHEEKRELTEDETSKMEAMEGEIRANESSIRNAVKIDALKQKHNELGEMPTRNTRANIQTPHDNRQTGFSKGEQKDLRTYKVANVFRAGAQDQKLAGIEREIHDQMIGTSCSNEGYNVPFWALGTNKYKNVFLAGTDTSGGNTIPTLIGDPIDVLREYLIVAQAGVRSMTGMTSNFELPKFSRGSQKPEEKPESASNRSTVKAEEIDPTTTKVSFSPHRLPADLRLTEQVLIQSNVSNLENYLTDLVRLMIAERMEQAVFTGNIGTTLAAAADPAGANSPNGLFTYLGGLTSEPQTVALAATGAKLTRAGLESMIKLVDEKFALMGGMGWTWMANQQTKSFLRQEPIDSSNTDSVYLYDWRNGGDVLGYPLMTSGNVPKNLKKSSGTNLNGIVFGKWSDAMIATFGSGVTLLRNPYIQGSYGEITFHLATYWDFGVLRDESFSIIRDAKLA